MVRKLTFSPSRIAGIKYHRAIAHLRNGQSTQFLGLKKPESKFVGKFSYQKGQRNLCLAAITFRNATAKIPACHPVGTRTIASAWRLSAESTHCKESQTNNNLSINHVQIFCLYRMDVSKLILAVHGPNLRPEYPKNARCRTLSHFQPNCGLLR